VKDPGPANRIVAPDVTQDMKPIRSQHVAKPGLVVVDIAAADDDTAFAFQEALAGRWATATDDRTTRTPGEPGVRLRCYLDLRQEASAGTAPSICSLTVVFFGGTPPRPRGCSGAVAAPAAGEMVLPADVGVFR
jgi:hypothetical protein